MTLESDQDRGKAGLGVNGQQARRSAQYLIFLARRIAAAVLALQLLLTTAAGLGQFRVGWLAVAVTACAVIVLITAIVRPQLILTVAIACAVLCVIQLGNLNLSATVLTVAMINPWLRLGQWMFALGPAWRVGRIGLIAGTVAAIAAMAFAAATSTEPLHNIYLAAVCGIAGLASSMALAICCAVVVRSGAADDRLRQARIDAAAANAHQQAKANSARTILRYLHNTVVNTLHAIAMGAGTQHPNELRQRCANDLAEFPELNTRADTTRVSAAEIAAWATSLGQRIDVDLQSEASGEEIAMPKSVHTALITALSEAILNTAKHAPGVATRLRSHSSPRGIWLQLTDEGPGIDTDTSPGFGLTESIFASCRSHHIEVAVTSSTSTSNHGTTVELLWNHTDEESGTPGITLPPLLPGFTQAYRQAAPWLLALCLIGPLMIQDISDLVATTAGWLLIAATTVIALATIKGKLKSHTRSALASVILAALASACYAGASSGEGPNVSAYAVGLLGLVSVAAITLSRRWLVAAWLSYGLAVTLVTITTDTGPISTSNAIALSNVIPFACLIAVLTAYGRRTQRMTEEATMFADAMIKNAEQSGRNAAIEQRWRAISPEVTELLTDIAEGHKDSTETSVTAQAARLESYTRALLAVPVTSKDAQQLLTTVINEINHAGMAVEIRIVDVDDSPIPLEVNDRATAAIIALRSPSEALGISLHSANGHGVLVIAREKPSVIAW